MFFQSSKHSANPDFIVIQVVEFFCRRCINVYSRLCFFLLAVLRLPLKALFSNSFVSYRKNGALWFKWLKGWILVQFLQCIKNQKGDDGLQVFHTMFQCMVCLESYKIWVFKTCKPYSGPHYGQFMILMYAKLLYGQFMTSMQPYVTI